MAKEGGSSVEHYEFLACMWLNFINKCENHDQTFSTSSFIEPRFRQFNYQINYVQKVENLVSSKKAIGDLENRASVYLEKGLDEDEIEKTRLDNIQNQISDNLLKQREEYLKNE